MNFINVAKCLELLYTALLVGGLGTIDSTDIQQIGRNCETRGSYELLTCKRQSRLLHCEHRRVFWK